MLIFIMIRSLAVRLSCLISLITLTVCLSCEAPIYYPPDQGLKFADSLGGKPSSAGEEGGVSAGAQGGGGSSAGMGVGGLSIGGASLGGTLAGAPIGGQSIGGVETSLGDWGVSGTEPALDPSACGRASCGEDARCALDANGEARCICDPRYEGDGQSCEPQPCPPNASGAPTCACDEGFEGELYYELSSRSWMGSCLPVDRVCHEGRRVSTSCGVGVCRADGYLLCEGGEWVEYCEPEPASEGLDLCDQLDSDCDGALDEDFIAEDTSCGLGVCSSSGVTSCEQGRVFDSCQTGASQGRDASCDGLDQDCDGSVDESFSPRAVRCGVGTCEADGQVVCEAGEERSLCNPEPPSGNDSSCDGLDQDCDGLIDEGYAGLPVTCGVGACFYNGLTRCVNGQAEEVCVPLPPAEDDVSCDGVDDDCDERVDEDFSSTVTSCGVGVCQRQGLNRCEEGVEYNDCAVGLPEGDDSSCNAIDEDCDGTVDEAFESYLTACEGEGSYACPAQASVSCVEGAERFDCDATLSALSDETCDGVDDDCDGTLDEDYEPVEVSCGQGVCHDTSVTSCVEGVVTDRCVTRAPSGDDSDCDGRDDDCDGVVDESFTPHEVSCGSGLCSSVGEARCEGGVYVTDCTPAEITNADESACDGVDNDCDGRVDEAYLSTRTSCGDGVCVAVGSSSCSSGTISENCTPLLPTGDDADCDGVDQDCDASTDESYPPVIDECGTGVCYNTAASSCVEGIVQNNCVELPQQGDDSLCDGIDQDCDGLIDEAYQPVPTTCLFGSVCVQPGLTQCVNGSVRDVCDPPSFYTGSDNSCNNQDNDCDGRMDEAFVGGIFYCGNGVCQGSGFRSCINGVEGGGSCTTSDPTGGDGECNGIDEDCDGRTDEHYGTRATSCGQGVCQRSGTKTCSNGNIVRNCSPGDSTGDDSTLNGLDDDCDGRTDEHAIPPETNCDGQDNDLDGSVDEGYGVRASTCGNGACASTGTKTCVNGSVQDTCVANTGNDNDCDNQDEDCDGSFDEHYNGGSTSCGTGACARTGSWICSGGSPTNTCQDGNPSNEVLGNGVDDDCDGSTDEGAPAPVRIGTIIYRCDFTPGKWYTASQNYSSGQIFYSSGLECYRVGGSLFDNQAAGYVQIDGTLDFQGTCTNICQ